MTRISSTKIYNTVTGCIAAVLFLVSTALAQDIGVSATVDKTEATIEDAISLSVTVSGTQNSPTPQLPPLPEFRVQSLGTSSSVQIINLKMNSTVTFSYRMNPIKTGTFVVQPITVTIDEKTYTTEPITLHIKEPSAAPAESNAAVFAQTTISNDKPYVNEQVILTLKLFRRVDVKNINLAINYDGFRKEDLGKDKEYDQVVNGINYRIHELAVAIFPTKAGTIEISPATLELDVLTRAERRPSADPFAHFFDDSFFFGGRVQAEHKTIRTNPLSLKVHALPESGKPINFSNLVGQFAIFASMGKDEVDVGDSATLTVTVSGKGNARDIPEPKLELRDNFKVYPDQPEFKLETEGNKIAGKKIFRFAVVPLREGKATIPPIHLTYFNPEQKKYADETTKPLMVRVRPSKTKDQLNAVEADNSNKKLESKAIKIIEICTCRHCLTCPLVLCRNLLRAA